MTDTYHPLHAHRGAPRDRAAFRGLDWLQWLRNGTTDDEGRSPKGRTAWSTSVELRGLEPLTPTLPGRHDRVRGGSLSFRMPFEVRVRPTADMGAPLRTPPTATTTATAGGTPSAEALVPCRPIARELGFTARVNLAMTDPRVGDGSISIRAIRATLSGSTRPRVDLQICPRVGRSRTPQVLSAPGRTGTP